MIKFYLVFHQNTSKLPRMIQIRGMGYVTVSTRGQKSTVELKMSKIFRIQLPIKSRHAAFSQPFFFLKKKKITF